MADQNKVDDHHAITTNLLHFDDLGKGEPILLINGLARSSRHWLDFLPSLAKHFRVIAPDNPGVGRSLHVDLRWGGSVFDLAARHVEVLDHLQIQRATVIGQSLGGMIAMALALKYPKRVKQLVLLNTSIADYLYPRIELLALANLLPTIFQPAKLHEKSVQLLLGDGDHSETLQRWLEYETIEPVNTKTVYKQLLAAGRFRLGRRAKQLRCPTLILYGEQDRFVSPRHSFYLHRKLPGSVLQSIPGGGHEMCVHKPNEVVAAIKLFTQASEQQRPNNKKSNQ